MQARNTATCDKRSLFILEIMRNVNTLCMQNKLFSAVDCEVKQVLLCDSSAVLYSYLLCRTLGLLPSMPATHYCMYN
jgi:hypothetical protein